MVFEGLEGRMEIANESRALPIAVRLCHAHFNGRRFTFSHFRLRRPQRSQLEK